MSQINQEPRQPTEMELALINSRRAGKRMAVDVDTSRGDRPIVNLRELADETGLTLETPEAEAPVRTSVPETADPVRTSVPGNPVADMHDLGLGNYNKLRPLNEELEKPVVPPRSEDAPSPPAAFTGPQPCARCGHRPGDDLADVPTADDKVAYVESVVLGDRQYEKAYTLFDGKLTLVFTASTHEEYMAGQALVAKKGALSHFRNSDEMLAFAATVRTVLTLRTIRAQGHDDVDYAVLKLPDNLQNHEQMMAFDAAVADRVKAIGARFHIALQAATRFESNYRTLMLRSLDENF